MRGVWEKGKGGAEKGGKLEDPLCQRPVYSEPSESRQDTSM